MDNDIPAAKVPSVVKNAFEQQYTNAVDVEWEKSKKNFEVDFEIANVDYTALYHPEGRLIMAKHDISKIELPSAVAEKIAMDFADYFIDDVDRIEIDGTVLYQVELEGSVRDRKVVYTAEGQEEKTFSYWDWFHNTSPFAYGHFRWKGLKIWSESYLLLVW